jgi:hypothetical protein
MPRKPTSDEIKAAVIGAVVALIIGGGTMWYMAKSDRTAREALEVQKQQLQLEKDKAERERDEAKKEAKNYRSQFEDAPTKFTRSLGKLIDEAVVEANPREGKGKLIPAAKALVAARNGFSTDLQTVREKLDAELDALERELSKSPPDMQKIAELVEILKRKWSAKKDEIELAVRKVITELGLTPAATK